MRTNPDCAGHMKYGIFFSLIAVLLATVAVILRGWLFLLLWPALSVAIVAMGYFHLGPRVYGKSACGLLSPTNQLLLFPYLLCLRSLWHLIRFVRREPPFNQLTDCIFIGRRLLSRELPDDIDRVIDLTCEFNEPRTLRWRSYHSFQILDGLAPSPEQLRQWVERVAGLSGNIYIHCAEGRGRTGLFAAALLLHIGHSPTAHDALQFIKSKRPHVRLGKHQLAVLHSTRNVF